MLNRRIIPALAGNTWASSLSLPPNRDHPRSRGEYKHNDLVTLMQNGSSPLSRGIRAGRMDSDRSGGIIPALAGNTMARAGLHPGAVDHPRSRGEYFTRATSGTRRSGSSPLSRGIRRPKAYVERRVGIIPALAGNTIAFLKAVSTKPDHPRSRGEYLMVMLRSFCVGGSSPLSRGILLQTSARPHHGRIIPALAGNTHAAVQYSAPRTDHPRSRGEYSGQGRPA